MNSAVRSVTLDNLTVMGSAQFRIIDFIRLINLFLSYIVSYLQTTWRICLWRKRG